MAKLGPVTVPDKVAPYLKFAVALAGAVATAIIATVAGPPAWVYIVLAVATALGVKQTPNINPVNSNLIKAAAAWAKGVEAAGLGGRGGDGTPGAYPDLKITTVSTTSNVVPLPPDPPVPPVVPPTDIVPPPPTSPK